MKKIGTKNIEKLMVICIGLSLPLITLRVNIYGYSPSLFILLLGLTILLNIENIIKHYRFGHLDLFILAYAIYSLLTTIYTTDTGSALIQWLKFASILLLYNGLKTIFSIKPFYFWTIIKFAMIALSIYLVYLMYYYLYKFGVTFIGIETGYRTEAGKNSLAFVVSMLFPFILHLTIVNPIFKVKIINVIIFITTVAGAVLIHSRALLAIIFIYFISLIIMKRGFNTIIKAVLYLLPLFISAYLLASRTLIRDLKTRISSFLILFKDDYIVGGNEIVAGIRSIETRSSLFEQGFQMASENPLFGGGLGEFKYHTTQRILVSHNDYIRVLAEQGLIGLILFLTLIGSFLFEAYRAYKRHNDYAMVFMAVIGMSIYLFAINGYDSIHLWFILSMVGASSTRSNFAKIEGACK